jgi:hypothetical protein
MNGHNPGKAAKMRFIQRENVPHPMRNHSRREAGIMDMQALFVASGAAIRKGIVLGSVSNLQVAPTIAKILGLNLPEAQQPLLNDPALNGEHLRVASTIAFVISIMLPRFRIRATAETEFNTQLPIAYKGI